MKTEIYYFTGSGNSLAIARKLAINLNADMIPVAGMIDTESMTTPAETIGIVFPIYDFKAPEIVEDFIKKLKNIDSKYIFSVCTYGVAPLKAMKKLAGLIGECGGKLSGGFAIKMPHNGIGSKLYTQEQHEACFLNSEIQLKIIDDYVMEKKQGRLDTNNALVSLVISGLFLRMIPTMFLLFRQVIFKGWKSLALNVNEYCAGCETCSKVCPVKNIKMVDRKPLWGDHCTGCAACLHWCPNAAIQLSQTNMNMRQYHHPSVEISDMMRQRSL